MYDTPEGSRPMLHWQTAAASNQSDTRNSIWFHCTCQTSAVPSGHLKDMYALIYLEICLLCRCSAKSHWRVRWCLSNLRQWETITVAYVRIFLWSWSLRDPFIITHVPWKITKHLIWDKKQGSRVVNTNGFLPLAPSLANTRESRFFPLTLSKTAKMYIPLLFNVTQTACGGGLFVLLLHKKKICDIF